MSKTIKVSAIEGNRQRLDGGAMFGNAPRAMWQRWIQPDENGRIELACRALLIEVNDQKILCETGIGAYLEPKLADRFGVENPQTHCLLANLKQHGVAPEEIDWLILSHLHFDHAGGLLPTYEEIQESGARLVFPRAQFVVGETAWQRASNPHPRDRASFIPEVQQLLQTSDRLHIVKENQRPDGLIENIRFFESSGHTPGQLHTVIEGPHNTLVFCGDLIPGSHWIHLPLTMGYDRFPEQVIDEKSKLYQIADLEKWIFFFTHDPAISAGRIKVGEKGRYQLDQSLELENYGL